LEDYVWAVRTPVAGSAVIAIATTALALAGCGAVTASHRSGLAVSRAPVASHRSGLAVGRAPVPARPAPASRALCRKMPGLTGLVVHRIIYPRAHFRFAFPPTVVVTSHRRVHDVARALCALPKQTEVNCANDFGVTYRLRFYPAWFRLTPVLITATGCGSVTGLGAPLRAVTARFWRILGTAMGLARPGVSAASLLGGTLPWLAGVAIQG